MEYQIGINGLDIIYSSFWLHPDPVLYLDKNGNVVAVNAKCEDMFGSRSREMSNRSFFSFVQEDCWACVHASFQKVLSGSTQTVPSIAVTPTYGDIEMRVTFVPILSENEVIGVYAMLKDIREEKRLAHEINRLKYFDELTQLPNQRYFQEHLEQELLEAKQNGQKIAIIIMDLEKFEDINAFLGFQFGDHLLLEIADRLVYLSGNCTVARVGRTEFAILLQRIERIRDITVRVEEIYTVVSESIACGEQEILVSPNIGISIFPQDGDQSNKLLQSAYVALNRSKKLGGSSFCFYSRDYERRMLDQIYLANDLRRAIDRDQLQLDYQPMLDVRTGEIIALEALVRWNHPTKGLIPPTVFVPIAEESDLIELLSYWVLKKACKQAKELQAIAAIPFRIAVNVSAKQFQHSKLPDEVRKILLETGLDATNVELEITESSFLINANHTFKILQELREMGIQISIDDFGTGYSTLSYLKRFPINHLKIDKSFIKNIDESLHAGAIVKAIITMAHQLNLKVTAEGVETKGEFRFLREHDCDVFQGYLIAKPMSFEALSQFIKDSAECMWR